MDILVFTHDAPGSPKTRELFGLVGEFCASATLRAELGTPISSAQGDTWLVAQEREGEPVAGFCVVSRQKNGRARLHALLAPTAALSGALRRAAATHARAAGAKTMAHTAPSTQSAAMCKDGWRPAQVRGQYITFEKDL